MPNKCQDSRQNNNGEQEPTTTCWPGMVRIYSAPSELMNGELLYQFYDFLKLSQFQASCLFSIN